MHYLCAQRSRRSFCWLAVLVFAAGLGAPAVRAADAKGFSNPVWSPDGSHLALTGENNAGVYILDTASGKCVCVTDAPSSGYAYAWSADSGRLGFKLLASSPDKSTFLQIPAVYDLQQGRVLMLNEPVARAGVPSFATDGRIAFTIDRQLMLVSADLSPIKSFDLGTYANLAPIAPNGSQVAYNDGNDQIWVLDLVSGEQRQLTSQHITHFAPLWSPDSGKLVISTVRGQLKSIEVGTGRVVDLDEGVSPSWSSDSSTVYYCKTQRLDGIAVLSSDMRAIGWQGTGRTILTLGDGTAPQFAGGRISPDGGSLACVDLNSGAVERLNLSKSSVTAVTTATGLLDRGSRLADAATAVTSLGTDKAVAALVSGGAADGITLGTVRVVGTVPYIHQVYDTPNWFSGHWACGATSATMGMTYYGILNYWDCTVSSPYSHTSHYGRYICETYSYNGYTYNISSPDPNGVGATGGYGYIVRNDWADTKGYMRDYILHHGLGSSVDWSPTWDELRAEVNNNTPFVLLNSLTSSGHYILTIGYFDNQRTAIFNDPYGNKNSGYMNYNGAGVYYDWPGYSNGYSNLNNVSCFIYCRGSINVGPSITSHPAAQNVLVGGTATFSVTASGSPTLSYQWQKNGSNLSNGGHYAGVTGATLTVSSISSADVASYRCKVTNPYGNVTSNAAALTIGTPPGPFIVESRSGGFNFGRYSEAGTWADSTSKSTAPGVTAGIGSRVAYISVADRNAVFSFTPPVTGTYDVSVTGPSSTNAPQSVHHVVTHAGGSTDRYVDQNQTTNAGFSTRWNSLGQFTMNSGATYTVTITTTGTTQGAGGTAMRSDAVRWVPYGVEPPTITQQPESQLVCPGSAATFTVAGTGDGTLSYQWQKNGVNLSNGGHYAGATSATLTVSSADATDLGAYQCVVSNMVGPTTSNAAPLGLRSETDFAQQPAGQRAGIGGTAVFAVEGEGEGTLSYQWQKDGVDLAEADHYAGVNTASLTVSNCDASVAGMYRCVVTAECGSATSNAAVLLVGQPADFDGDSDVDLEDWGLLQVCIMTSDPACAAVDLNGDARIDEQDTLLFVGCLSEPGVAGNPQCTPMP